METAHAPGELAVFWACAGPAERHAMGPDGGLDPDVPRAAGQDSGMGVGAREGSVDVDMGEGQYSNTTKMVFFSLLVRFSGSGKLMRQN